MQEKTLFVKDFMHNEPLCLAEDIEILKAISIFLQQGISGAPVVEAEGRLIGMLTERDCIKVAVNAGYFNDFGGKVKDFMTTSVETVTINDNLMDVAQRLIESSFHRYPVTSKGKVVGLITRRDVLKAIEQKMIN